MSQAVIEKISLPIDFRKSRRDSFEIANQFRKFRVAGNPDQHVQVIWHQQKQL